MEVKISNKCNISDNTKRILGNIFENIVYFDPETEKNLTDEIFKPIMSVDRVQCSENSGEKDKISN
jgi:hypothetical protein